MDDLRQKNNAKRLRNLRMTGLLYLWFSCTFSCQGMILLNPLQQNHHHRAFELHDAASRDCNCLQYADICRLFYLLYRQILS